MAGKYFVRLEHFEGPLDLLLHLIRVHELNIFNIDLLVLTTQYLNHLRLMRFRDLKDAATFLEMAATLIEIKSRSLLPGQEESSGGQDDSDEPEDPALALQKRLIEYEHFKRAAAHLAGSPATASLCCPSGIQEGLAKKYESTEAPLKGDPATLLILYEQMLTTLADRRPVTIKAVKDSITVEELIERLRESVEKSFFLLFQSLYPKITTRYEFVAWILAILQLVRDRELKIHQETMMGPVWIYGNNIDRSRFLEDHKGASPHAASLETRSAHQ